MKKKILSIILATAMFASYSVPTFAEENVSDEYSAGLEPLYPLERATLSAW